MYKVFFGLLALGARLICTGDGFVVIFDVGNLGEPVIFAVDGAHVVDDGVQINFFVILIFVRHVTNIVYYLLRYFYG